MLTFIIFSDILYTTTNFMVFHMLKFQISWICTFFAINDTRFHFCEVIPRAKTSKMLHEEVKNPLESHESPLPNILEW